MSFFIVDNLSCGYKDGFMVNEISLNLPKGAFAGIIGGNGSGKSTILKGITGELSLLKGTILMDDIDILTLSVKERSKRIAVVSQFIEKYPMTAEEYVLMGRTPFRKAFQFFDTPEDREEANYFLELTGISHLKNKLITQLSGGEQQMVALACALTQKPSLLLLDEPTSHLDITYQSKIMNLLHRLNEQEGLTVIMIIHDLNLAGEYCNHLTLIKDGRIVIQGEPKDVISSQNINTVYNTSVYVATNPISGKPAIFQVSEKWLQIKN
jgi:iron complex transport system ATP-binding protein